VASLAEHNAARNDDDLTQRFIAAAEQLGVSNNAQMWVDQNRGAIVAVRTGEGEEDTISDAHAYAVATYNPPPRPGVNPAAVTDNQIKIAIQAVKDSENQ